MSIQNFNTFQNLNDTNLAESTQEFMIQALANLGQRYSLKGDGFATHTASMYDLIENFAPYDSNSYICKVDYNSDKTEVEFQIVDKNLTPVTNINVETIAVSNIVSSMKEKAEIANVVEQTNGNMSYNSDWNVSEQRIAASEDSDDGEFSEMTVTAKLKINTSEEDETQYEIAAFCGNICCGIATNVQKGIIFTLNIYGKEGEKYDFFIRPTANQENHPLMTESLDSLEFRSDGYGSEDNPYIIKFTLLQMSIAETDLKSVKNVFMYSNKSSFVFSLEEIVDENDSSKNRFVCEKYNKYANRLESAIRIFCKDIQINELWYDHVMIYLLANGVDAAGIPQYKMFVYYMNFDNIPELKNNGISTIARHAQKKYKDINSNTEIDDSENSQHEDIDGISFSPETFITDLYGRASNIENMPALNTFSKEGMSYIVTYKADTNSYELYRESFDGHNEVYDNYERYKKLVEYFAYDQTYMYRQLKSSYSEMRYLDSTENSSYKKLILDAISNLFLFTYCGKPLYIPLDYSFEFTYNTNNPWQVYFSTKDIILRDVILMVPGLAYTVNAYRNETGIIRVLDKKTDVEKTTFYSFNIEYDSDNPTNIYGVTISKHFTLPYINNFGYWVIDDIESEVYARGRDAGNPNIIIVETVIGKDLPTILTMSNKEYFESMNWVTKSAYIEMPLKIVNNNGEMVTQLALNEEDRISPEIAEISNEGNFVRFKCNYLVPTLNNTSKSRLEENVEKLKYSIILNVATVESVMGYDAESNDKFSQTIKEIYGENGRIMTFWTLEEIPEEKCGYGFKALETKNGTAIDMNYLSNFMNTIGWVISNYNPQDPDNFTFSQLVFDRADSHLLNNSNTGPNLQRVYPVIKNESFRTASDESFTGLNNFNMQIQFNDRIEASYRDSSESHFTDEYNDPNNPNKMSYIDAIRRVYQSDTRYYEDWMRNNDMNNYGVSNEIYPQQPNKGYRYNEYVPGVLEQSIPTLDLSEVFVRDLNSLNRVNVISFNKEAMAYYSYIGTDYTSNDKSVLKIGTSNVDINIGTSTMINAKNEELFKRQNEIDIEFDKTRIASYTYIGNNLIAERDIICDGTLWNRYEAGGVTYWSTRYRASGRFFGRTAKVTRKNNSSDNTVTHFLPTYKPTASNLYTYFSNSYMYAALTVPEKYKTVKVNGSEPKTDFEMYIGDMIWVPGLIRKICPQIGNFYYGNVFIESNNDVYYTTFGNKFAYIGIRQNSAMLNDKNLYRYETAVLPLADREITYTVGKIYQRVSDYSFISNELDISYYVKKETSLPNTPPIYSYYFKINDLGYPKMTYLYKIQDKYPYPINAYIMNPDFSDVPDMYVNFESSNDTNGTENTASRP